MGLFDRLFGKKEEPKIEEVVKEALENLDLSEDIEPAFTEAEEVSQEEAEVESSEESVFQEEDSQDTVEENLDLEPVVEVSQEEVEEFPNSQEVTEEEKLEHEGTIEENNSEVLEPETPQTEETVQEKYDRSLKKTRTGFGARLNAFFANFRSVDEEFFEELEELLIMSDVGVQVASNLTEELRYEAKLENAKKPDALR
ncbi:signal recognition particle-docking protein FtsY, partial [Streptococcus pneumoniae]